MSQDSLYFALQQSHSLGEKIAAAAGAELSALEERVFDDGEHKCRPLVSVRKKDVFVVHSLYSDTLQSSNDKLCQLLFFIGALYDAGANTITALLPYLAYARKDQKTKPFDPTTTRYIANLFKAVGTTRVITLGVHNRAAMDNAFQCHYEDVDPRLLFVNYFYSRLAGKSLAILAPDSGAIKNCQKLQKDLIEALKNDISFAVITKTRSRDLVQSSEVYGDIDNCTVLIYDDMISTGTTICHAIEACERRGVREVFVAAVHGVFSTTPSQLLDYRSLEEIVITNSVTSSYLGDSNLQKRLVILDCAPLLADF